MSTAPPVPTESPTSPMCLLGQGVPLSLLMDLATGPHSAELFTLERPVAGLPSRHGSECAG